MIIVFNEIDISQNIISVTNRMIDKLNDEKLCKFYLNDSFNDWIYHQLIIADYEVKKILNHLLSPDDKNELLIYNIDITHPIQEKIIPQLIQELIVSTVSEMWCVENNIPYSSKIGIYSNELKSVSLKTKENPSRKYRIIY